MVTRRPNRHFSPVNVQQRFLKLGYLTIILSLRVIENLRNTSVHLRKTLGHLGKPSKDLGSSSKSFEKFQVILKYPNLSKFRFTDAGRKLYAPVKRAMSRFFFNVWGTIFSQIKTMSIFL